MHEGAWPRTSKKPIMLLTIALDVIERGRDAECVASIQRYISTASGTLLVSLLHLHSVFFFFFFFHLLPLYPFAPSVNAFIFSCAKKSRSTRKKDMHCRRRDIRFGSVRMFTHPLPDYWRLPLSHPSGSIDKDSASAEV